MLRLSLLTASIVLLGACATGPTTYAPIGDGKTGFYEQAIESDRFRVTFVGKNETEARDLAILRAAEIARGEGYSHFEVLQGVTEADGRQGGGTNVGVGIGSGGGYYGRRRTNVGVGIGFDLGSLGGQRVSHSIEVKLRRGNTGESRNIFAADSVLENVGARIGG